MVAPEIQVATPKITPAVSMDFFPLSMILKCTESRNVSVLILFSATFALFTLTIIHFKRQQGKTRTSSIPVSPECLDIPAPVMADGVSPSRQAMQE